MENLTLILIYANGHFTLSYYGPNGRRGEVDLRRVKRNVPVDDEAEENLRIAARAFVGREPDLIETVVPGEAWHAQVW